MKQVKFNVNGAYLERKGAVDRDNLGRMVAAEALPMGDLRSMAHAEVLVAVLGVEVSGMYGDVD